MLTETQEVVQSILELAEQIHVSPAFNERYLHHALSAALQRRGLAVDPTQPLEALKHHPEWPTYKRSTAVACGRYGRVDGKYSPKLDGTTAYVDFISRRCLILGSADLRVEKHATLCLTRESDRKCGSSDVGFAGASFDFKP